MRETGNQYQKSDTEFWTKMRQSETAPSGVRDRGWPTRTERHRIASGDTPRLAQPDRDSDRRRPEATGHPFKLSVWGPASTTSHAMGQTDAAFDSNEWSATARGFPGAWGQAGYHWRWCGETMIVPLGLP